MLDAVPSLPCPLCLWEASVAPGADRWALRVRLRVHLEVVHATPPRAQPALLIARDRRERSGPLGLRAA